MKISAAAVSLVAVMCVSACSSGSSHPKANSTALSGSSSSTSSSSSGSSSMSSSGDAALLAQVKPLQGAGKGWVVHNTIDGYGSGTIVVDNSQDGSPATKLMGLASSDGHQVWSLDLTKAPKALTVGSGSAPQFHQIGSSLAVTWTGTSGGDTLNTGTPTAETAVYDLNTGKQRGQAWTRPNDSQTIGGISTSLAYGDTIDTQNGTTHYFLQDGTLDSNTGGGGSGVTSTYDDTSVTDTAIAGGASISAQDVDANTAIWSWTAPGNGGAGAGEAVFVNRKTHQPIGHPVSCTSVAGNGLNLNSLDLRQIQLGSLVADTMKHTVSCFNPPTNNLQGAAVARDGTAYLVANNHLVSMKPGSSSAQTVPVSNALPGVIDHAAVYVVTDSATSQKYTVVFPAK